MDPKSQITPTPTLPLSILVVDDEPLVLASVQRALSDNAHEVVTAACAEQARALLRERHFDAIILDVHLDSEPDGIRLLSILKQDPGTSRIPVFMVTGDPCGDILPTALAKGAADGLQKPLNFEILRIKLDRLAEAARRDSGSGGLSWGRALILHVEDDDEWANLVRNWLAGKNFNLHRVAGRIGLLDFLARCARLPDCIVLDLGLGEDDGLRICDELKANPRWQRIPILILTSRSGQRLAGFRHRAVALVAKMSKSAGEELVEALTSIIVQQEKAAGVFELGDLRLDPRGPHIYHNDKLLCSPAPREFAIMRLLIERSPHPVSEADIRAVSCKPREESRRNPFDPKPNTIQVYISNERRLLGDVVGSRIVHVPTQGYAYIPPSDNLAK